MINKLNFSLNQLIKFLAVKLQLKSLCAIEKKRNQQKRAWN